MNKHSERRALNVLLKVVGNPVNLQILVVLSGSEMNTKELARLLNKCEADISRRMKLLRELGLVTYRWVRVGSKNVKYYRLSQGSLEVRIRDGRVFLAGRESGFPLLRMHSVFWRIPRNPVFVGREKEIREINNLPPGYMLEVTGIPGVGKTSLVAEFLRRSGREYLWYSFTGSECLESMLKNFSLYLTAHGLTRLQEYMLREEWSREAAFEATIDGLDKLGTIIVLDDFHKNSDPRVVEMVRRMLDRVTRARIIVVSRKTTKIPPHPKLRRIRLEGLSPRESLELIEKLAGVTLDREDAVEILSSARGHPLLLSWIGELIRERGVEKTLEIVRGGGLPPVILEEFYKELSTPEKRVLHKLLCLGGSIDKTMLPIILKSGVDENGLALLLKKNYVVEEGSIVKVNDIIAGVLKKLVGSLSCKSIIESLMDEIISEAGVEGYFKAFNAALELGDEKLIAKLIEKRNLSIMYKIIDYAVAYDEMLNKALGRVRGNYLKALILYEKGMVKLNTGDEEKAKLLLKLALPALSETSDSTAKMLEVFTLTKLAILEPSSGERYLKKAYEVIKDMQLSKRMIEPLLLYDYHANATRFYVLVGDYEKALEHVRLEAEAGEKTGDPVLHALGLFHKLLVEMTNGVEVDLKVMPEIRGLLELSGLMRLTLLVAYVESMLLLSRGEAAESYEVAREYFEKGLRRGMRQLSCELAGVMMLASLLDENLKPPSNDVVEECLRERVCSLPVALMLRGGVVEELLEKAGEACDNLFMHYAKKAFSGRRGLIEKISLIEERVCREK